MASQLSVTWTGPASSRLAQLLMSSDVGSAEFNEVRSQLDEAIKRKAKRTPAARHEIRENAVYVDPDESGRGWTRPMTFSLERAQPEVFAASNDYSAFRMKLSNPRTRRSLRGRTCRG